MGHRRAGNVVGHRASFFGLCQHLVGGHVEERCTGINEAADQPRAGDAVDLGPLTRNPARGLLAGHTPVGSLGNAQRWPLAPRRYCVGIVRAVLPAFDATGHPVGIPALGLQRGCGGFADVMTVDAVDEDFARRVGCCKCGHVLRQTAFRAGQ